MKQPSGAKASVQDSQRREVAGLANASVLPDILNDASFYADSYALRRPASTQQVNMMNWLKTKSAEKILSHLPSGSGRALRMFSIGCGDGELDLSLMEGCKSKIGSSGQFAGIDFVGLEPNLDFRNIFTKNLKAGQGTGLLPPNVTTSITDKTFHGDFVIDQDGWRPDLVMMGHVLYYFGGVPQKVAALRRAIQMADPQGRVVVIHHSAQGVPEIQQSLLPLLRGSTADMFTADDIENVLRQELEDDISGFVRHDIDAFLDVSEIVKGSPEGIKVMSFCIEADHRAASENVMRRSIAAFEQRSQRTAEPGRGGGPFMAEPVVCFVIEPRKYY